MRKIYASLLSVALAALALTGCSAQPASNQDKKITVGIAQYVSHPSLDAAVAGFKRALDESELDVVYDEQNSQGDQGTANSIAGKFASNPNLDLILAVATPIAQTMVQNITETPILFTAVTDPVKAQLVNSLKEPGENVSGTTDLNPVAAQVDLVKQVHPQAKTLGIIYSAAEINSQVQADLAKEQARQLGLKVVEKTITNTSEVIQAVQALGQVDAIYVPTDNMVVSALGSVVSYAEENSILVVAAEADSVENGAALTYGLDYNQLGYQTGQMALKILRDGSSVADLPVESQENPQLVVNPQAAKRMGHELPAQMVEKADRVIE